MTGAAAPDVSVIVAVYNTMPYLTHCLESVLRQSIGLGRLEVVAVDDGSTDGSAEELDRFAHLHPDTVRVLHQANSGGPADPSNRALALARGRYVFFLGSDDFLGEEALLRLVDWADEIEADVVAGRMEGVNGRYVHQSLYQATRTDLGFTNSDLPWTLSNTKLFRRSLIERHGLRFPEDLAVGSDQPFTVAACVHARQIAVLADYTCYYAVRRENAQNITYAAAAEARLEGTARIMESVAALIPAGEERDAVLLRHFSWELSKLFRPEFLDLPPSRQENLAAGVAALADRFWTPPIRDAMPVHDRVAIGLAQAGALDALIEAVRERDQATVGITLEGGRALLSYPGFRDPRWSLDDSLFDLREGNASALVGHTLSLESCSLEGAAGRSGVLEIRVRTSLSCSPASTVVLAAVPWRLPASADRAGARRLPDDLAVAGMLTVLEAGEPDGTSVRGSLPLADLVTSSPRSRQTLNVRMYLDIASRTYEIPVPSEAPRQELVVREGRARYRATVEPNPKGRLIVRIEPLARLPVRRAARRLLRPLTGR